MFDIPNDEKMPQEFSRMFQQIRNGRQDVDSRAYAELRASSFPICPKAYHIYRRTPVNKRPLREEAFVAESTSLMGTALHLVLQRWFGMKGYLYGNWKCVHCRIMVEHKTGIQNCPKCRRQMIYEEYEVQRSRETPFSGHIDGILRMNRTATLIDFKGSSARAIREIRNSRKPKETHYLQTNAYANAVNLHPERYGNVEKIEKIIIIYVDRGEPHRLWHSAQVPVSRSVFKETVARIYVARDSLKKMEIPRGLCLTPSDSYGTYCKWKQICFSPAIEGLLDDKIHPTAIPKHKSENDRLLLASYLDG